MKLWSMLLVGTGVLGCSLLMAQQPGGPGGPPPPGEGHGPGRPPANPIMEALDPDHDHEISAEEIAAASSALMALDTNGDGKLTEDEFRPEHAGPPPHEGGGPPREEADRRSGPPRPELGSSGSARRPGPPGGGFHEGGAQRPDPGRMVEHAFEFDADGDDKLSREELMEFAMAMPPPGPGGPGGPDRMHDGPPRDSQAGGQRRPARPDRMHDGPPRESQAGGQRRPARPARPGG